jgi:catechol 2,3-dioxygenase-like lactoylglutathione lyase family enzyme
VTQARDTVLGVDHFGATVKNMERSLGFWHTLLGIPIRGRGLVEWPHLDELVALPDTRIEWVELEVGPGHFVELSQYHRPPGAPVPPGEENQPGRTHLSLLVSDLEGLLTRLLDAGVRVRTRRPVTLAQGAYSGSLAVYVFDPDGIELELIQRRSPRQDVGRLGVDPVKAGEE